MKASDIDRNQVSKLDTSFDFAEENATQLKAKGLDPYGVAMRRALQSVDDDIKTPTPAYKSVFMQKLDLLRAAASKPNLTEKEMRNVAVALLA